MKALYKFSKPVLLLVACFILALQSASAQMEANEQLNETPWYRIPWLWIGILAILAGIMVYVTFWKSK
ncbi:MAG: hypothetical protein ACXWEY_06625 [Bacteroidia bacterium]